MNGSILRNCGSSSIKSARFDAGAETLPRNTRIGKYVLNHSFMMPGLVATSVSVAVGLFLARIIF